MKKEVVVPSPTDKNGIVKLFNKVFDWGNDSVFDWKFNRPDRLGNFFMVGKYNAQVVAFYGGYFQKIKIKNRELKCIIIGDSSSSIDKRSELLFLRTSKECIRSLVDVMKVPFGYGISSPRATELGIKSLGLRKLERYFQLSKYLFEERISCENQNYKVEEIAFSDPEIATVWKKCQSEMKFGIVRDSDYLCWRYRDNPINSYTLLKVSGNKGPEAILVLSLRELFVKNDSTIDGIIMDLIIPYGNSDKIFQIFSVVESFLLALGVCRIKIALPSYSTTFKALRYRANYTPQVRRQSIVFASPDSEINEEELGTFFYTFGDWDVY